MSVLRVLLVKGSLASRWPVYTKYSLSTTYKSDDSTTNKDVNKTNADEFTMIYTLPAIKAFTTINRLKFDLTFLTCVSLPTSFVCSQLSIIPQGIAYPFTALLSWDLFISPCRRSAVVLPDDCFLHYCLNWNLIKFNGKLLIEERDVRCLLCIKKPLSQLYNYVVKSGGVGCVALNTLGLLSNRLIGAMYISSDSTLVKLSYCDYWGRRKDLICPISDVVRLSELQDKITDPYVNFRRYSTPEKFRLSIKYGSVLDVEKFIIVLGKPN